MSKWKVKFLECYLKWGAGVTAWNVVLEIWVLNNNQKCAEYEEDEIGSAVGDAWWGDLTCPGDQGQVPWEVTLRLKPDRCVGGWEVGCGGGHGTPEARKNSCRSQYYGSGSQDFRAKRNFRHNLDLWLGSEPWIHTGIIGRAVKNPDVCLHTWVINSDLWGGHTGIGVCTELPCWLQCAAKLCKRARELLFWSVIVK